MGALIDGIANLFGASQQSKAIDKGTAAQTAASDKAIGFLQSAQAQSQQNQLPWLTTGSSALSKLAGLYGLADGGTVTANGTQGGVNAGATGQAPASSGQPNYSQYLAANPDIAAESQRVIANDKAIHTLPDYLKWHDQHYAGENRPSFADPVATTAGNLTSAQPSYTNAQGNPSTVDPNASFYQSPDYNFRLQQGLNGVNAGAAARGMLDSGATRKAEIGYAGNLASGEYNSYVSKLQSLAGVGQTAATNLSTQGQQTATQLANTTTQQGDNLASSYLSKSAAWNGAIQKTLGDAKQSASMFLGGF